MNSAPRRDSRDRYQGFDLDSVSWGYRETFRKTIEALFDQGCIGGAQQDTTRHFFDALKNADKGCYDHVLREFLASLGPVNHWVLKIPSLFSDLTETGYQLSQSNLSSGIQYYRLFGAGALGSTPRQLRYALSAMRRVAERDPQLACSFAVGFSSLTRQLSFEELDQYIQEGLEVHFRNKNAGYAFMSGESKASELTIRRITRECRLADVKERVSKITRALSGREVTIDDLSALDSDDLLERDSRLICACGHLYLPARIRHFESPAANRDWYILAAVCASALLAEHTFVGLHGRPGLQSCVSLTGPDPRRIDMFAILEYVRGSIFANKRWPGLQRLFRFGVETHMGVQPPQGPAEKLLFDCLKAEWRRSECRAVRDAVSRIAGPYEAVEALDQAPLHEIWTAWNETCHTPFRSIPFLPDILFPVEQSLPREEMTAGDQKQRTRKKEPPPENPATATSVRVDSSTQPEPAHALRRWYPEWSQEESAYRDRWCGVEEIVPAWDSSIIVPPEVHREALSVARAFERMKPDLPRTERRLESGDEINIERLVTFLTNKTREPQPRVDFYEKPSILRRDLSVMILLDVSGSTSEKRTSTQRVIDVVKHTAVILGFGLERIGDRFAVTGFTSNGREECSFFIYKGFTEQWSQEAVSRLMNATPRHSTRIGPALRHAGFLMSDIETSQRLILLITDGKPMDTGYSAQSLYAQHDVRMACEENIRRGITTFAISTEDNTLGDMELMFGRSRFAILDDIARLPGILPKMYLRLTL